MKQFEHAAELHKFLIGRWKRDDDNISFSILPDGYNISVQNQLIHFSISKNDRSNQWEFIDCVLFGEHSPIIAIEDDYFIILVNRETVIQPGVNSFQSTSFEVKFIRL